MRSTLLLGVEESHQNVLNSIASRYLYCRNMVIDAQMPYTRTIVNLDVPLASNESRRCCSRTNSSHRQPLIARFPSRHLSYLEQLSGTSSLANHFRLPPGLVSSAYRPAFRLPPPLHWQCFLLPTAIVRHLHPSPDSVPNPPVASAWLEVLSLGFFYSAVVPSPAQEIRIHCPPFDNLSKDTSCHI